MFDHSLCEKTKIYSFHTKNHSRIYIEMVLLRAEKKWMYVRLENPRTNID